MLQPLAMRMTRSLVLGLLFLVGMVSAPVSASTPSSVISLTQAGLLSGADSIRLKVWACLARGDIAGALALYEAQTGHAPPAWLLELQVAYSAASQAVGKCQQVARSIHTAFTQLGQAPEYIAFKANDKMSYIAFELTSGNPPTITRNGYHVAVRVGDMIYDAYTGPLGMKLPDYLSRLHSPQGVAWQMVTTP